MSLPGLIVKPVKGKQFFVGTTFCNVSVFQDDDFVCMTDGTDTVRDDELGRMGQPGEGLLDGIFRFHIQCAGRIIQHQHRCMLCKGPRDGNSLLLTAGQADAAFADYGIILIGEPVDKFRSLCVAGSEPHVGNV